MRKTSMESAHKPLLKESAAGLHRQARSEPAGRRRDNEPRPSSGAKARRLHESSQTNQCDAPFVKLARLLETLPKKGSVEWRAMVAQLQRDLDPSRRDGFTVLDTAKFFPPVLADAIFETMPHPGQADILDGKMIAHDHSNKWVKMSPAQLRPFNIYATWLVSLLNAALQPEKPLRADQIDLRMFSGRISDDESNVAFQAWHTDGGEFAALLAMKGTGTGVVADTPRFDNYKDNVNEWVRANKPENPGRWTPTGKTLIMSGTEREGDDNAVAATVHSSPFEDEERFLILLRISS